MNFLSENPNVVVEAYESVLVPVASVIFIILEIIGIIALVAGVIRAIVINFPELFGVDIPGKNIRIDLGHAFALGLEFKMGAEIIKTVLIHDLKELAVLGVIIVLRAALAFLILWEIRNEEKERALNEEKSKDE